MDGSRQFCQLRVEEKKEKQEEETKKKDRENMS
jgi:hypothetical protein